MMCRLLPTSFAMSTCALFYTSCFAATAAFFYTDDAAAATDVAVVAFPRQRYQLLFEMYLQTVCVILKLLVISNR